MTNKRSSILSECERFVRTLRKIFAHNSTYMYIQYYIILYMFNLKALTRMSSLDPSYTPHSFWRSMGVTSCDSTPCPILERIVNAFAAGMVMHLRCILRYLCKQRDKHGIVSYSALQVAPVHPVSLVSLHSSWVSEPYLSGSTIRNPVT